MMQTLLQLFTFIGAIAALKWGLSLLSWLNLYFLMPAKSFERFRGTWAIVTGASWGIGYGFAKQLAKRGVNVVLIARSADRLKEVAQELESKYKIQTRVVVADFSSRDLAVYDKIEEQTKDLKITILVNNVGITTEHLKFFHEMTAQEMDELVHVNIDVMNHMTRVFLPQMRQRKQGLVIVLSSNSAVEDVATPLLSVYAGTKAYNNKWARSVAIEVAKDGVEVLSITPAFVTSKMTRVRKANIAICDEDTLASTTLTKVGYGLRRVTPWVNHAVQEFLMSQGGRFMEPIALKFAQQRRDAAVQKKQQQGQQQQQQQQQPPQADAIATNDPKKQQ